MKYEPVHATIRHLAAASLAAATVLAQATEPAREPAGQPGPCAVADAACHDTLLLADAGYLDYYRTFALDRPNGAVTRAVLVIHGGQRTPERYFKAMVDAAAAAGVISESLIVAPGFKIAEDKPDPQSAWWDKDDDWKKGELSAVERRGRISSFEVADQLVTRMADRRLFPKLREVVITGHSSGGQFTQRYAAGSSIDRTTGDVAIRFVVANPSSYMYLSPDRPKPGAPGEFARPEGTCDYDKYKHGLSGRNLYMSRVDAAALIEQYRRRDVTYLLGTADIDPNHDGLDNSCAGMTQGRFRFERGLSFMTYMDRFFAPHRHRTVKVPDVGHEGEKMFGSIEGQQALFGQHDAGRRQVP